MQNLFIQKTPEFNTKMMNVGNLTEQQQSKRLCFGKGLAQKKQKSHSNTGECFCCFIFSIYLEPGIEQHGIS